MAIMQIVFCIIIYIGLDTMQKNREEEDKNCIIDMRNIEGC